MRIENKNGAFTFDVAVLIAGRSQTLAVEANTMAEAAMLAREKGFNVTWTPRKVTLIGCAKEKRTTACPARELYVSQLFNATSAWAEKHSDKWFILSAKHGLVHPDTVLEPYDVTLNDMAAPQRREWARMVMAQLDPLLIQFDQVNILAGRKYRENLEAWLTGKGKTVRLPLQGRGIGVQKAWLKANT